MIDLHSHLLFDFDDGAKDIPAAERILKAAADQGVRCMVATSHAGMENDSSYDARFQETKALAEKYDITLIPGMEHSCHSLFCGENEFLRPLGESRFLLLDCGTMPVNNALLNRLMFLSGKKYKIILAHPERIWPGRSLENIAAFSRLFPVAVQVNSGSMLGMYGGREKREAWQILEAGLCHIIASDVHYSQGFRMAECRRCLSRFFPETMLDLWFEENPRRILADQMPLTVFPDKKEAWKRALLRIFS